MSEMVERVAKAIVEALKASDPGAWIGTHAQDEPNLAALTIDGTFDIGKVARAVVHEMREATEAMQDRFQDLSGGLCI